MRQKKQSTMSRVRDNLALEQGKGYHNFKLVFAGKTHACRTVLNALVSRALAALDQLNRNGLDVFLLISKTQSNTERRSLKVRSACLESGEPCLCQRLMRQVREAWVPHDAWSAPRLVHTWNDQWCRTIFWKYLESQPPADPSWIHRPNTQSAGHTPRRRSDSCQSSPIGASEGERMIIDRGGRNAVPGTSQWWNYDFPMSKKPLAYPLRPGTSILPRAKQSRMSAIMPS